MTSSPFRSSGVSGKKKETCSYRRLHCASQGQLQMLRHQKPFQVNISYTGDPLDEWHVLDGDAAESHLLCPGHRSCHGRHDRLDSEAWSLWLLYLGSGGKSYMLLTLCKSPPIFAYQQKTPRSCDSKKLKTQILEIL